MGWSCHPIEANLEGASTLIGEDMDGDGDTDVVGSAATIFEYTGWWENLDGTGTSWDEHQVDMGRGTFEINVDDADGDGDPDLMGALSSDPTMIVMWENAGGADTWIRHEYFPESESPPRASSFSDMDTDGVLDVTAYWSTNKIAWFEYTEYNSVAWVESTILELMIPTDSDWIQWGVIDWDASTPEGTSVMFQMRAGMDPDDLGPWTEYITTPGTELQELLSGQAIYAQYKTTLISTDPESTPTVTQMMVGYTTTGGVIGESRAELGDPDLYLAGPNPCRRGGSICCVLAEPATVSLGVWDLSGRLVSSPARESAMEAGTHVFETGPLSTGVYICHLRAGEMERTVRLVVIP